MKLAIGPKLIALCVQAHPLGGLLLCTYPNVSDGRFGVASMLMYAHAARNNSALWTFQANLFAPSSTLNPVGRKKTVFSVWERTGRDWMAAAWAVAQPLMGVFVGGPSGADYLGGNCLPRWA